jgi:hypothetical protein
MTNWGTDGLLGPVGRTIGAAAAARPLPPTACRWLSCREGAAAAGFAPVALPPHPTYDVYAAIDAALAEDAGDFGDISTLST